MNNKIRNFKNTEKIDLKHKQIPLIIKRDQKLTN
jgi:hypothetical protein